MEYLIKVEVVGDYDLRATGFMDSSDSVILNTGDKSGLMEYAEVIEAAKLMEIAKKQIAILREANPDYDTPTESIEV